MTEPDPTTFLTFKQVLDEYPYVTDRWLRRAVHDKKVPFYKLGGRLLFDPAELDQWIRDTRVEPATKSALKKSPGRRVKRTS